MNEVAVVMALATVFVASSAAWARAQIGDWDWVGFLVFLVVLNLSLAVVNIRIIRRRQRDA